MHRKLVRQARGGHQFPSPNSGEKTKKAAKGFVKSWKQTRHAANLFTVAWKGIKKATKLFKKATKGFEKAGKGIKKATTLFSVAWKGLKKATKLFKKADKGFEKAGKGTKEATTLISVAWKGIKKAAKLFKEAAKGFEKAGKKLAQYCTKFRFSAAQTAIPPNGPMCCPVLQARRAADCGPESRHVTRTLLCAIRGQECPRYDERADGFAGAAASGRRVARLSGGLVVGRFAAALSVKSSA